MSLKVENVTKLYGTQKALDNVSLELQKGEIVALLGPNGAGKSTLMKIITCYLPQTSGQVTVNGYDVEKDPLQVKKLVGYLPEHNPLYLDMYVKEYLFFVAGLHKLGSTTGQRVSDMIEKTGLNREQHKKIGALSKGYRQRVGIAQALLHNPDVLILDEPTTGLDPNQIIEIRELIQHTGEEKTVLLSTHIMQEVQALCNRVIIINSGEIVADAPTPELQLLSTNSKALTLEFETLPNESLFKDLKCISGVQRIEDTKYKLFYNGEKDTRAEIFRFIVASKLTLTAMYPEDQSIEQIFRQLTNEQETLKIKV